MKILALIAILTAGTALTLAWVQAADPEPVKQLFIESTALSYSGFVVADATDRETLAIIFKAGWKPDVPVKPEDIKIETKYRPIVTKKGDLYEITLETKK